MTNDAGDRIIVAGIGNVLRGDDGFGPAVIGALSARADLPETVRLVELGIGGVGLVHELMDGCAMLVIVDAVDRGRAPGSLYVLEAALPPIADLSNDERYRISIDMHETIPERALVVAQAAGVLPAVIRIVGCQPLETETFSTELTPAVRSAVPDAVDAVLSILERHRRERPGDREPAAAGNEVE